MFDITIKRSSTTLMYRSVLCLSLLHVSLLCVFVFVLCFFLVFCMFVWV